MLPEDFYRRVIVNYDNDCELYQTYKMIQSKYNLIKNYLPYLVNKDVLEIGCNAGWMTWYLMDYCSKYTGLEPSKGHFKQCLTTFEHIRFEKKGDINVLNATLKDMKNIKCNALYASFVLYHLEPEEIDILENNIFPQCNIVIIPNRAMERSNNGGRNKLFLNRRENVRGLLERNGFQTKIYDEKSQYCIMGEK